MTLEKPSISNIATSLLSLFMLTGAVPNKTQKHNDWISPITELSGRPKLTNQEYFDQEQKLTETIRARVFFQTQIGKYLFEELNHHTQIVGINENLDELQKEEIQDRLFQTYGKDTNIPPETFVKFLDDFHNLYTQFTEISNLHRNITTYEATLRNQFSPEFNPPKPLVKAAEEYRQLIFKFLGLIKNDDPEDNSDISLRDNNAIVGELGELQIPRALLRAAVCYELIMIRKQNPNRFL
jgi:hypothetical protein